jgi:uncharacterized protein YdeI (YjbR/CyaY-like superfamily)
MMKALIKLEVSDRQQWRKWLRNHSATSRGVWLVFHKNHTEVKSIPYEDSVREALCFGWIDSLVKRLDADRYARKFTPRKPASKWSDANRKRWVELKSLHLLTRSGLAVTPTNNAYAPQPVLPSLPAYIARALKTNPKAWSFFQALAPTYRRHFAGWIHTAKQRKTREKRIRESIALLAAGKKLGLK